MSRCRLRGRGLREGQDFRLPVGETGAVSAITACPLCPAWQACPCEVFAWMARKVWPIAIWVEDDWRLHNHESDQGWRGSKTSRSAKERGSLGNRLLVAALELHPAG